MPQFATLTELENELNAMGSYSPEYWDKQVHLVPRSRTVDRNQFLSMACTGKTILHIGCTGQLDRDLTKVSKTCYGIDKSLLKRENFYQCDLDDLYTPIPYLPDVELVICGEVLEHLSNPGLFLQKLRGQYTVPLIITVPNAMTTGGLYWLEKRGRENVNADHVCYYTYTTLKTLLKRYQYEITQHYWYNGKPYTAEGLIALVRPL